jgi:hypothetical protein
VDSARSYIPRQSLFNFLQDRAPISLVSKPDDRQEYRLLECAENFRHTNAYIVGLSASTDK